MTFALGISRCSRLEHLSDRITESLSESWNLLSPAVKSPPKSENNVLVKFCEKYKNFDKLVLTWGYRMSSDLSLKLVKYILVQRRQTHKLWKDSPNVKWPVIFTAAQSSQ
jgi:hypothetical protein